MQKRVLGFVLCAVLSFVCAADSIVARRPANNSMVTPLRPEQRLYSLQNEAQVRALFRNGAFFVNDLGRMSSSQPRGVEFQWKFSGNRGDIHYELQVADNAELNDALVLEPPHSQFFLHNLEIGKKYYWKAAAVYKDGGRVETEVQCFTVESLAPRVMYVPNVDNFRDLGGKKGLEGRISAQGMIYRSTGLNNNSTDGGKTPGGVRFTTEGKRIMLEDLKLKTEVDLRAHSETAGMTESPLGPSVKYINISSCCYGAIYNPAGRENYAQLFRIFCDRSNYPINFHCIAGADRTGSLGFLLGAVLGYSVDDLIIDFTYTTFMASRTPSMFDTLYRPMMAYGSGDEPLAERAERYLLQSGITAEEIQAFRDIMLGPGTKMNAAVKEYSDALMQASSAKDKADGLKLNFQATDAKSTVFCGKEYDVQKYACTDAQIHSAADGQGGFIFIPSFSDPEEALPLVLVADADKLTAKSYTVSSPNCKLVYTHDGGKTAWTAAELNSFCCNLPNCMFILQVKPGKDVNPAWQKVETLTNVQFPELKAEACGKAPVLDGVLDDDVWKNATWHSFKTSGTEPADDKERVMACAFNEDASVLYLAAKFYDETQFWSGDAKHDSETYNADSIEIFLSSIGAKDYYQFVFNGKNEEFYDGKNTSGAWNAEGVKAATQCKETYWTLELEIPLAQFGFTSPLEMNVCASDSLDGSVLNRKLFNIWQTNGSFHSRAAIHPVLKK